MQHVLQCTGRIALPPPHAAEKRSKHSEGEARLASQVAHRLSNGAVRCRQCSALHTRFLCHTCHRSPCATIHRSHVAVDHTRPCLQPPRHFAGIEKCVSALSPDEHSTASDLEQSTARLLCGAVHSLLHSRNTEPLFARTAHRQLPRHRHLGSRQQHNAEKSTGCELRSAQQCTCGSDACPRSIVWM
ncbi:hypothetical protein TRVL_08474 [Trypanosoma vivax]|nr:hypothetical protein TRVL_08474 [Trypanosoma vivax]